MEPPGIPGRFIALIASRYERASLVVSPTKTFSAWWRSSGTPWPWRPWSTAWSTMQRSSPSKETATASRTGPRMWRQGQSPPECAVFNRRIPRSFRPALTDGRLLLQRSPPLLGGIHVHWLPSLIHGGALSGWSVRRLACTATMTGWGPSRGCLGGGQTSPWLRTTAPEGFSGRWEPDGAPRSAGVPIARFRTYDGLWRISGPLSGRPHPRRWLPVSERLNMSLGDELKSVSLSEVGIRIPVSGRQCL